MFFADFFPLYLFILPLSCWMKRVPSLRKEILGAEEAERHCKLCLFLDFTEHSIRVGIFSSLKMFLYLGLLLSPYHPLPQRSYYLPGTTSTLLNICEKFRESLVLGKLWTTWIYMYCLVSSPSLNTEGERGPFHQHTSGRISGQREENVWGREPFCWLMSSDHITEAIAYLTC